MSSLSKLFVGRNFSKGGIEMSWGRFCRFFSNSKAPSIKAKSSHALPITAFSSFSIPTKFSLKRSIITALLDANFETPHPKNSLGSRNFVQNVHSLLKGRPLHNKEEVEKIFHELLMRFFNDNVQIFQDTQLIAVMPSSTGKGKREVYTMAETIVRQLKLKANIVDLLVRTSPMKTKMSKTSIEERKTPGGAAEIQFPTLVVNSKYKKELKNKSVLLMDDNLVYGNTSEAARHLLFAAGCQKYHLFTPCTFGPGYFAQNITLSATADPFSGIKPGEWTVVDSEWITKPRNEESVLALVNFVEQHAPYCY